MKHIFLKKVIISMLILALTLSVLVFPVTVTLADDTLISSVEVTQIMGKGIDLDSGKYFFMNTFVAEKPTSIQVILTQETEIKSASLDIYYEGNKLTTASPKEKGRRQLLTFTPAKKDVGAWKSGRYKFTATVNGVSKTTEAIFNASRNFSILVISASVKHGGKIYEAPDLKADTITLRTQAMPVSESKLKAKYRNAKIAFGTGADGYDIGESSGSMKFLSDIENYRTKSAQNYDVVVAIVNAPLDDAGNSGGGKTGGYTNSSHAVVVTVNGKPSAEELETTLLHELGHILGNGDEYTGGSFSVNVNGAPYGVTGSENGKTVTGNREHLSHADNNQYSGILIKEVQNPYNPKSDTAMLNRSSFMGSSYKHWPTSMVWEEAYKHLISNYQNVLPRVYTDGSIVAARPTDDELSDVDRNALISEFRNMLNEVRAKKGLAPYKEDNILASGQKHLHTLSLDILKKRGFEKQFSLEPTLNAIRAETNSWIGMFASESSLYEYDSLQYWRDFFTESPCGDGWIKDDYMFVDFVKCDGITYFMYTTIGNVLPNKDDDEKLEPQPDTTPVPEVNPVTNDIIDPGKFANGDYEKPANNNGGSDNENGNGNGGNNNGNTNGNGNGNNGNTNGNTNGNGNGGSTATPKPGESSTTPAYADLTKGQRLGIFNYDGFDMGYLEQVGTSESRPYPANYVYGLYAWYANEQYGLNITANDAKKAIDKVAADGNDSWDGVGMVDEAESSRFDLVCVFYGLYPPKELRDNNDRIYVLYPQWRYGRNPKRAKNDNDSIDPNYGKKINDGDINDPDGNW